MRNILTLGIMIGLVWLGYSIYRAQKPQFEPSSVMRPAAAPLERKADPAFRCDGRTYCSQMTSCAEATYFIQHCPNTKMDGDNDGVPCESQWCT